MAQDVDTAAVVDGARAGTWFGPGLAGALPALGSGPIVVPLDGSAAAEGALPYAAGLARATGGRVVLVRASLDVDLRLLSNAQATRYAAAQELAAARAAEAELTQRAAGLRAEGVAADVEVRSGSAAGVILDAARRRGASLVVLPAEGQRGRWRGLGAVAGDVLRRADAPVLLVPPAGARPWPPAPAGGAFRVLVLLDGSAAAEEALGPAGELAAAVGGSLLLLRVVEPAQYVLRFDPVRVVPALPRAGLEEAERYLDAVAWRLRRRGHTVVVSARPGADAAETIARIAGEQRADAIAMATQGRGGLARLVLGGTAAETLRRAEVPLLLVRPGAARRLAAVSPAAQEVPRTAVPFMA